MCLFACCSSSAQAICETVQANCFSHQWSMTYTFCLIVWSVLFFIFRSTLILALFFLQCAPGLSTSYYFEPVNMRNHITTCPESLSHYFRMNGSRSHQAFSDTPISISEAYLNMSTDKPCTSSSSPSILVAHTKSVQCFVKASLITGSGHLHASTQNNCLRM